MSQTTDGDDDAFRSHWLAFPVELFLTDHSPDRPPITIQLDTGDGPMTLKTNRGEVRLLGGPTEHPDLTLTGTPQLVLGLLSGNLSLADAHSGGLRHRGDITALDRVRHPRPDRGSSPPAPQPPLATT